MRTTNKVMEIRRWKRYGGYKHGGINMGKKDGGNGGNMMGKQDGVNKKGETYRWWKQDGRNKMVDTRWCKPVAAYEHFHGLDFQVIYGFRERR